MSDTSLEIEAKMAYMLSLKTPIERLRMADSMFDAGKKLVEAGIREQFGTLNEAQMRAQVFVRIYGEDFSKEQLKKILSTIPNMQFDLNTLPE
jgi:hypothetical protein